MKTCKKILQLILPFVLGIGILWWMYRGTDWNAFFVTMFGKMKWGWMLLSLVFGVLAQQVRAWRWQMALAPLGEHPRRRTAEDAIFVSYAASLLVPRIGEVTRCGALRRTDCVSFTKSLGTVVTERIVDSVMIIILTCAAFFAQIPAFKKFLQETGMDLRSVLSHFTGTGYLVTFICIFAALAVLVYLARNFLNKGNDILRDLKAGISSLKDVKSVPLYFFWSLMIWVCYYLHFYIAFFCFDFTAGISPISAFLIFCIGTFAVIVPTPNGAGPWHFAVKTLLVTIYGVAAADAVMFALVVHTIQTMLVVLLGAYGWADINMRGRKMQVGSSQVESEAVKSYLQSPNE